MITITATATAAMTVTNWTEKFSYLNRISKEIRIKIKIKSIYDEAICFFDMYFIKKEINKQKAATDKFRLQSVCNKSFVVQWTHKMYFMICTHNSSVFTQWSHSDRIICSAFRIIYTVFFDLIFFFCMYWKRSSFFFFFFLIDFKEITIHNISMNLMKQWEFNSNNRTDIATMIRKEA